MMACGHKLTHYVTKCDDTGDSTCDLTPTAWLEDTCAECHPDHQLSVISRAYDENLLQAIADAEEAIGANSKAEKLRITTHVNKLLNERIAKTHQINAERKFTTGDEVLWPGKPAEDTVYAEFQYEHQCLLLKEEYETKQAKALEGLEHAKEFGRTEDERMFNLIIQQCNMEYREKINKIVDPPVQKKAVKQRGVLCVGSKGRVMEWLSSLP
jgi:hypothetical protein